MLTTIITSVRCPTYRGSLGSRVSWLGRMSEPRRAMLSRSTPSQILGGSVVVVVGGSVVVVGPVPVVPGVLVVVVVGEATDGVGWKTLVMRSCPAQRTYPAATCGASTSRAATRTLSAAADPPPGLPDRYAPIVAHALMPSRAALPTSSQMIPLGVTSTWSNSLRKANQTTTPPATRTRNTMNQARA